MSNETNTWKYVALGCISLLVILCCCCGGGAALLMKAGAAPHETSHAFLGDLRAENFQSARERMSESYKQTHDLAAFTQAAQAIPALTQNRDATLSSIQVNNDLATIGGVLETPQGSVPITLTLRTNATSWWIETVSVDGQLLQ